MPSPTPNLYVSGVQWDRASVLGLLPLIDCAGCGDCCRVASPIVIQEYELERIARYLGEKPRRMKERLERLEGRGNLWTMPTPCPYQRADNLCSIHEVRMVVCKYYPLKRVDNNGHMVVGVYTDCESGQRCIEQLLAWQQVAA